MSKEDSICLDSVNHSKKIKTAKKDMHQNGPVVEKPWPYTFDRTEYVTLLGQELDSLGYSQTVARLEEESGVEINREFTERLQEALLSGDWFEAECLIVEVTRGDEEKVNKACRLIQRQTFLELIEADRTMEALELLRATTSRLGEHHKDIRSLSSLLICTDKSEFYARARWTGAAEGRLNLLSALQSVIDSKLFPQKHQLAEFIEQAMCPAMTLEHSSLFEKRQKESLSIEEICSYERKDDLIWSCAFSHCGLKLAYGLASGEIVLTGVTKVSESLSLNRHMKAVTKVLFSPNGSHLLSSSQDGTAIIWSTHTGAAVHIFQHHQWPLRACAWLGGDIVTCSEDGTVVLSSALNGLDRFEELQLRANDLLSVGDDALFIATPRDIRKYEYGLESLSLVWTTRSAESITSLCASPDGMVIAADSQSSVYLIRAEDGSLLRRIMTSPLPAKQVVRSCLTRRLLLRGEYPASQRSDSEQPSAVNVWEACTGNWVDWLQRNKGGVNAIACPPRGDTIACAGEDGCLSLWNVQYN